MTIDKLLVNMKIPLILTVMCAAGVYGKLCGLLSSSPTCQQLRQIKLSMDDTVDPCDDFYSYACNNWGLQHSSSEYNNPIEMLDYQLNLNLISVLDSLETQQQQPPLRVMNETYYYYKSCLNARGTNALRGFLDVIKPGEDLYWPLLEELDAYNRGDTYFSADNWPAEHFDPYALLGQLSNYDINDVLFKVNFFTYSSIKVSTSMHPPTVTLLPESVIFNILKELGFLNGTAHKYSLVLKKTHDYWQNLHRVWRTSKIVHYSELKKRFPYFQNIFENIQIHRYNDNDEIEINREEYFQFLLEKQFSSIEKRNLCNYIMVRLLHYLQKFNVKSFTKLDCIKEVKEKLDLPLSLLYYGYVYMPEESQTNEDIQVLFEKTRNSTMQRFGNYFARNRYAKSELRKALNRISLSVGNMPKSMTPEDFDTLFGDLPHFYENNYYKNHLSLLQHEIHLRLMQYNKTHLLGSYSYIYSGLEGAFYDGNSNLLILQFIYLQPPFYHPTFDPVFKWSMLGYFLIKALFSSLYYTVVGSNLEFRDVDPIDVAYHAYVSDQRFEKPPQFSNISWKKLFFLNAAQFFCAPNNTLYREKHSRFVRSFPLKLPIFKEAFQCGHNNKNYN